MIFYEEKDDRKEIDYIQCDLCESICNKFGSKGSIHITFPDSHPDIDNLKREEKINGKDFCCHNCAKSFLENCQKMIFRLKMKELINE